MNLHCKYLNKQSSELKTLKLAEHVKTKD